MNVLVKKLFLLNSIYSIFTSNGLIKLPAFISRQSCSIFSCTVSRTSILKHFTAKPWK